MKIACSDDCRVLLVMQEGDGHQRLAAILHHGDCHHVSLVRPVADDVLTAVRTTRPDLVIVDLCAPAYAGLEIMRHLQAAGAPAAPGVSLLVVSQQASAEAREQALALGATDFLESTAPAAEMALRIRNVMRLHCLQSHAESTAQRAMTRLAQETTELTVREVNLARAQAAAQLGSWVWDVRTNVVQWSDEMYRLYGYQPHACVPTRELVNQAVLPEDRAGVNAHLESALQGAGPLEALFRIRRPSGDIRWLLARGEVLRDTQGLATKVMGTAIDVTERQLAQLAVEASEQRFREIAECIRDVFWMNEPDGRRLLYVSPAFEAIWGIAREQLYANPQLWMEAILPADRERVAQAMQLQRERGAFDIQYRIQRPDQTVRWIQDRAFPVKDATGALVRIVGLATDITASKAIELERERLQLAVAQSNEIIIVTDAAGIIQYVNPAFERVTGYAASEAVGKTPRILKSAQHGPAFYLDLWQTITAGKTWAGRMVNQRKDGGLYTEEMTISPVRDAGGTIISYVAVQRDITAQLELETRYYHAQRMETVGRFAGGVAHDFNNLLAVIIGCTDLCLSLTPTAGRLRSYLEEIRDASERSATISRQLLTFARKQPAEPRVFDLNPAIEGMIKLLRRLVGEEVAMKWQPGAAAVLVHMDPSQVDQLLANLCVNARDAIVGTGSITITTRMETLTPEQCRSQVDRRPGPFAVLGVTDTGVGMSRETLEHLFEPFFTTKGAGAGTGLGLPTVYGIVKQNNGFIEVQSKLGKGTTFEIYLPECTTADAQVAATPLVLPVLAGHETILVVEDEKSVRFTLQELLESMGYFVLTASTPAHAIEMARKYGHRIDLLITDMVMPEMSGNMLAAKLLAAHPKFKCLFMSGYTEYLNAQGHVAIGDTPFLAKPFRKEQLSKKVREVLDCP